MSRPSERFRRWHGEFRTQLFRRIVTRLAMAIAVGITSSTHTTANAAAPATLPNVVVILADDKY